MVGGDTPQAQQVEPKNGAENFELLEGPTVGRALCPPEIRHLPVILRLAAAAALINKAGIKPAPQHNLINRREYPVYSRCSA
jgi:hypothetical protein